MLLCMDSTFTIELAAYQQLHDIAGKRMIETAALDCLPKSTEEIWGLAKAKQMAQTLKDSALYRWVDQATKSIADSVYETLAALDSGTAPQVGLMTSPVMKQVRVGFWGRGGFPTGVGVCGCRPLFWRKVVCPYFRVILYLRLHICRLYSVRVLWRSNGYPDTYI